jgi:preprotein translocase subunit YajC
MSLLDILVSPAAAQAAGAAPQGSPYVSLFMMGGLFIVFWFLMIRPQMKRAKEHRELLSKLQKGDEVITSGGIAGRIEDLSESFVTVEVADRVSIKVQRGAVSAVLPKGTLKSA